MNVLAVGLNDELTQFFQHMCSPDQHFLKLCETGDQALAILRHDIAWDWILFNQLYQKLDHREVMGVISLLKLESKVLVISLQFNIDVQAPPLCSIKQTTSGSQIVHCTIHNLLTDKKAKAPERPKPMPFILEYQVNKKSLN